MKEVVFTFSVIRYVHDPAAGEMLNVGVVLCAPEESYIGVQLENHFERLSNAFVDFDGEHYKRVVRQIYHAVDNIQKRAPGTLFQLQEPITDIEQLTALIMPDRDTSIQFGSMLAGITDDLNTELAHIFHRMITSQYEVNKGQKRSDDEVWHVYQRPLIKHRLIRYLKAKTFASEDYTLKFEHAFKNERWHVLQPVSLDYARPEGMQSRATVILGTATVLKDNPEIGKLYLLLGPPKRNEHPAAYKRAKHLLTKVPIAHEIVEEQEAERFAKELAAYIQQHGIDESAE